VLIFPICILILGPNFTIVYPYVIHIDFALNGLYLIDFLIRFMFLFRGRILSRLGHSYLEAMVCTFLVGVSLYNVSAGFAVTGSHKRFLEVSAVVKFILIFSYFPAFRTIKNASGNAISGTVVIVIFLATFMLVYCVVGVNIFSIGESPDYGVALLNRYMNFNDPYHAWLLLMNVCTGNGWTGIPIYCQIHLGKYLT